MRLKSGERVVDRLVSHNHAPADLLEEALSRIDVRGRDFLVEEVEFEEVVGETTCVETGEDDEIVFAVRVGRRGPTRFVKRRPPKPCRHVTAVLKRAAEEEGVYVLLTAFIGRKAEPEPWDPKATEASVQFWRTHALVWGSEPVVPGTETPG